MDAHPARPPDVTLRFAAFAAAVGVFHHLGSIVPAGEQWIDHVTPFAVVGTAAWLLLALRPEPWVLVLAAAAAVAYADGHGIHLGANAINNEGPTGAAADAAHFWDEVWGHVWWHLGFFAMLGALCLADRGAAVLRALPLVLGALALGFTIFTNAVEGGDWWLALAAAAVFVPWAVAGRSPLRLAVGGAFALTAVGIGIWALWHGGVPQFSELGWL